MAADEALPFVVDVVQVEVSIADASVLQGLCDIAAGEQAGVVRVAVEVHELIKGR